MHQNTWMLVIQQLLLPFCGKLLSPLYLKGGTKSSHIGVKWSYWPLWSHDMEWTDLQCSYNFMLILMIKHTCSIFINIYIQPDMPRPKTDNQCNNPSKKKCPTGPMVKIKILLIVLAKELLSLGYKGTSWSQWHWVWCCHLLSCFDMTIGKCWHARASHTSKCMMVLGSVVPVVSESINCKFFFCNSAITIWNCSREDIVDDVALHGRSRYGLLAKLADQ